MDIISKKGIIENIVVNWKRQYPNDKISVTKQLENLNPKTEEGIVKIIGNTSWTSNICGECKEDCEELVVIGQDYDYESSTAFVCKSCINKASKLFISKK